MTRLHDTANVLNVIVNAHIKMVKIVNFTLCIFYNKKLFKKLIISCLISRKDKVVIQINSSIGKNVKSEMKYLKNQTKQNLPRTSLVVQ